MRRPLFVALLFLSGLTAPVAAQSMVQQLREARIGGAMLSATRTGLVEGADGVVEGTGTLLGGELVLRGGGFGLRGRALSGTYKSESTFQNGKWNSIEAALLVGPRFLSIEGGISRRTVPEDDTLTTIIIPRVGARSEWGLAGGLIQVSLSAGLLVGSSGSSAATKDRRGHDAEVSVLMQPFARAPIYLQMGYRYESLRHADAVGRPEEELSGIWLAMGLRAGR